MLKDNTKHTIFTIYKVLHIIIIITDMYLSRADKYRATHEQSLTSVWMGVLI